MNTLKLFGKRIKALRKNAGLTQEQLSERMGLFQKQIGNIETGTCFTTISNLEKFSEIFDINMKDLFDFDYFQERKVLVEKINKIIEQSTDKDLQRIYRVLCALQK